MSRGKHVATLLRFNCVSYVSVRHLTPDISSSSSYSTLPFFFLFHCFILVLPLISLLHNACVLLAIYLIAGFWNLSRMPTCTTHDNPDTCSSLFDTIFFFNKNSVICWDCLLYDCSLKICRKIKLINIFKLFFYSLTRVLKINSNYVFFCSSMYS